MKHADETEYLHCESSWIRFSAAVTDWHDSVQFESSYWFGSLQFRHWVAAQLGMTSFSAGCLRSSFSSASSSSVSVSNMEPSWLNLSPCFSVSVPSRLGLIRFNLFFYARRHQSAVVGILPKVLGFPPKKKYNEELRRRLKFQSRISLFDGCIV